MKNKVRSAIAILNQGGIIAYPTEAVYGLGCDPFNQQAVMQLATIKRRPIAKGFILIAANWQQVEDLVQPLSKEVVDRVFSTWPGPVTWVFPASARSPIWVRGDHPGIAIRLTAHPIARELCLEFGKPIISTSANREGAAPAGNDIQVKKYFSQELDFIVTGETGGLLKPTEIRDALTGNIIRKA